MKIFLFVVSDCLVVCMPEFGCVMSLSALLCLVMCVSKPRLCSQRINSALQGL
jgi:hypothetical protein